MNNYVSGQEISRETWIEHPFTADSELYDAYGSDFDVEEIIKDTLIAELECDVEDFVYGVQQSMNTTDEVLRAIFGTRPAKEKVDKIDWAKEGF